jgi:uncharacterized protein YciI
MAAPATQPVYYVVSVVTKYTSLAEAKEKASADIAAHIARSRELHDAGALLMAGAFLDRPEEPLSTMAVLTSREAAEDYIRGDPLVLHGMVSHWHIRVWANMLA